MNVHINGYLNVMNVHVDFDLIVHINAELNLHLNVHFNMLYHVEHMILLFKNMLAQISLSWRHYLSWWVRKKYEINAVLNFSWNWSWSWAWQLITKLSPSSWLPFPIWYTLAFIFQLTEKDGFPFGAWHVRKTDDLVATSTFDGRTSNSFSKYELINKAFVGLGSCNHVQTERSII